MKELEIDGARVAFEATADGITIENCISNTGSLHFPEEIDGTLVTAIGRKAMLGAKTIRQIWLPAGIREIGDWAFAHCSNLQEVWLFPGEIKMGKGVFKDDVSLVGIYPAGAEKDPVKMQVGRLLAALPVKLMTEYLLNPREAGTESWLAQFDDRLGEFLSRPDQEGYSRVVYCGEEDIMASMDQYLARRHREKAELCFLRLINSYGLAPSFSEELKEYIKTHTKGCISEASWEVVFEEHGTEPAYYEAFVKAGALTGENYREILSQMGEKYPEMKGYLMRTYAGSEEKTDFFEELSLDF